MEDSSTTNAGPEIPIHPAADIFPPMSVAEFEALKADIKEHGQREPIVLLDGKILDGRHRDRACREQDIEPDTITIDVDSLGEGGPIAFVLSRNLHRRHLDESQRAMIGARAAEAYKLAAKERQKRKQRSVVENLPPQTVNGKSRDSIAAAVNVSGRTVDHASTVLAKGSKELIAAVDAGEVAVSKAAGIAKSTPKPDQVKAAKKKSPTVKKVKAPAPPPTLPSGAPLDLAEALNQLDGLMRYIYGVWPKDGRTTLASKLRDWSTQLYESDSISGMEGDQ